VSDDDNDIDKDEETVHASSDRKLKVANPPRHSILDEISSSDAETQLN
jgi:hypothetical protein